MKQIKKIGSKWMAISHSGTSLGLFKNKLVAKRVSQTEQAEFFNAVVLKDEPNKGSI